MLFLRWVKAFPPTYYKKILNLSKEQEWRLNMWLIHLKWVQHNKPLDKFNAKDLLAEIYILLKSLRAQNVSNEMINDINVSSLKYIKTCSKQRLPRHQVMTKCYLKEKELLAVPFDKGMRICLMKSEIYKLVCNFQSAKLLFRRNNRIWRKSLFCKSSRVASNQVI